MRIWTPFPHSALSTKKLMNDVSLFAGVLRIIADHTQAAEGTSHRKFMCAPVNLRRWQ